MLAGDAVGDAELGEHLGVIGHELDGLHEPLEGVVLPPQPAHGPPDARVERGLLREVARGLLVGEGGLFVLARGLVERAQALVALAVLRVELDGPRAGGDGLVLLAQGGARLGQAHVRQRVVGPHAEARLELDARRLPALPLHVDVPEVEAQVGVVGRELHGARARVGGALERAVPGLLVRLGVGEPRARPGERLERARLVGHSLEGGVEGGGCGRVLAERHLEVPEPQAPVGPRRVALERRLVRRHRLVELLQLLARAPELLVRVGVLGAVVGRVLQRLPGVVPLADEVLRHTKREEDVGIGRRELDGADHRVERLVDTPEPTQGEAHADEDLRLGGPEAEARLVRFDGEVVGLHRLVDGGDVDVEAARPGLELDGAEERGDGVLVLPELEADLAEELVGLGHVFLEAERVAERARRVGPGPHPREGAAPGQVQVAPLRGELHGALEEAGRLGPLREDGVRAARLLVRLEVVGRRPGDVAVGRARLLVALEAEGDLGERELCLVVIGLERGRLHVGVGRVVPVGEGRVGDAELEVRVEVLGLDRDGARERLDGVLGLPELQVGRPELEARVRVLRVDQEVRRQQIEELLQLLLGHGTRAIDDRRCPRGRVARSILSRQGRPTMSEEPSDWALVGLDPKTASKQGVPPKIPVPTADLESIGDKGMTVDAIRGWVTRFMAQSPVMSNAAWRSENAALVKSFEAFVGKKDAWAKAQAAFGKRDFKGAIGALKMIAAIDPADHAARLNLASALAAGGDHAGALAQLDAIAETWADEAEFHVTRGNVLLSLERRDDAIGAFVDALEHDGSNAAALDTLKGLGVLVAVYEDPRDAASLTYVRADSVLAHLEQVWDEKPRDVGYYFEQVAYHEMERRPQVALAAAERAIARGGDPPHARAVSAKIASLRALGRLDEATALARKAAAGDPSAAALVDLARCQLATHDVNDAVATLDQALAADPGDLMAIDLRWWPAERHDLALVQEAMPSFQAHADAHPAVAGAWRTLGRAKLAVGDAEAGVALLAKAVELAPGDDDARAEWWSELLRHGGAATVLADAAKQGDMRHRDWKLRWNEADAYAVSGKAMEAQASFAAINHDEALSIDVRKRAKRAATSVKTG